MNDIKNPMTPTTPAAPAAPTMPTMPTMPIRHPGLDDVALPYLRKLVNLAGAIPESDRVVLAVTPHPDWAAGMADVWQVHYADGRTVNSTVADVILRCFGARRSGHQNPVLPGPVPLNWMAASSGFGVPLGWTPPPTANPYEISQRDAGDVITCPTCNLRNATKYFLFVNGNKCVQCIEVERIRSLLDGGVI